MNESKNPQCVFLDTNVLVALYNKKDLLHQEALKIFKTLSAQKARLVVSNYVLLEIYTILSQRAGKKKAIEFGTMVRSEKPFLIKRVSEGLEDYQLLTLDKRITKLQKRFGFRLF